MVSVTFSVTFLGFDQAGKRIGSASFSKKVQLPFAPFPGLELEDLAWKGTRKVDSVTWNVDSEEFSVSLGQQERKGLRDSAAFKGIMNPYEISGWKGSIEDY